MKTLKNYSLVYDENCPLCRAYSQTFVNAGILEKKGRKSYQTMSGETCTLLDLKRAKNEIALINNSTGEVTYGIDSIITMVVRGLPFLKPTLTFAPIYSLLKRAYAFISYNRKIIMPTTEGSDTCIPDFNLKYRLSFLVFSWLITSLVLTNYSLHLTTLPPTNMLREFLICGGQIVFQMLMLWFIPFEKRMNYLGNMMTVSLAGSILLLIGIGLGNLFSFGTEFYLIFFIVTVLMMFFEHIRRCKLLHLNSIPTLTWTIYRMIILLILLK